MLPILSKIVRINELLVIGVTQTDSRSSYRVLALKRNRDTVAIVKAQEFDDIDTLVAHTGTKLPVILVLSGKGVLQKKVDMDNEADTNWYKSLDFSSINYTAVQSGKQKFISLCRQNVADEVTAAFVSRRFDIVDFYLGSFLSVLLYPSIQRPSILSDSISLEFDNGLLANFSKTEATEFYLIGEDQVNSKFLPLYSTFIHFLLRQGEVSKTQYRSDGSDERIYRKAFNFFGALMLGGFLVALLASYLLLQYYNTKNQELNVQQVYSNKSYETILNLERLKENKLRIADDLGLSSKNFLSFYGYEILRSIPAGISLDVLSIFPAAGETKSNVKIQFDGNTIVIKGQTYDTDAMNNWFLQLGKMTWIKKYEITRLKKDKKNKSQFELKITLADV